MKFSVFLLTIVLSTLHCVSSKGWNPVDRNDEYLCCMGWACYLKKLVLIIFMTSAVILYNVPKSRFYFRRGCNGIIDFVADGLKTALNITDLGYTTDDSHSTYSERETEITFQRKNHFHSGQNRPTNLDTGARVPRYDKIISSSFESIGSFATFSTRDNSTYFPLETIQICGNDVPELEKNCRSKNHDAAGPIFIPSNENRRKDTYSEKVAGDQQEFNIVEESEATNYPEDETFDNLTESASEDSNNCSVYRKKKTKSIENRRKFQRELFEFDKTLRALQTSFFRECSTKSASIEEYAELLIEIISDSLKRNIRKLKIDESMARRTKKLVFSRSKSRKLANTVSKFENISDLDYQPNMSIKKKQQSHSLAKKRYDSLAFESQKTLDIPIITNRLKPILERAARWFYGSCPNVDNETPFVGTVVVDKDEQRLKIADLWHS